MVRFRLLAAVAVVIFVALLLILFETTLRSLDGYPVMAVRLPAARTAAPAPVEASVVRTESAERRYLADVSLAPGVDASWYAVNPPPRPTIPMTPAIEARATRYKDTDPLGAFFVWNREYLLLELCQGFRFGSLGVLDDFFVFDPPTKTQFPSYRHLPNVNPPRWFPTNQFGWRGSDVPLNKAPGTIRIAFVGSSMTIDPYHEPFSHIEYLEEWLNRWAKARGHAYHIEVINAARTGIDAGSVAAIVTQELLPLEPDLVVFDGANDFKPGMLLKVPPEGLPAPAVAGSVPRWRAERVSALARRVRVLVDRAMLGTEPAKPPIPVVWPEGVDEQNPRVTNIKLPMGLDLVTSYFDTMRTDLSAQGSQLALSSQVLMVRDGLKLQLPRDQTLFTFLNETYHPLSYRDTRRLMDFQNKVFRAYADLHHLPYFDKAAVSPLDPELFIDAVHLQEPGRRLQSWIYLQWLAEWLDKEIGEGRLPRPMQHPLEEHPNLKREYPLLSKDAILGACGSTKPVIEDFRR